MNNKSISLIKNVSYTFVSNLISMLISILVVLIIPKILDVESYGYWQLYFFYASYVGFMHLGWNDGIYLRYGGKSYDELDKRLFFSQFWMLVIFQLSIGVMIIIASMLLDLNGDKFYIIKNIVWCMLIINVRFMLSYILQATNRIKEYSIMTMFERVAYFILVLLLLVFGVRDFEQLIIADLLGKFLSLTYVVYCCKDIVFNSLSSFHLSIKETIANINVGIKLMFANIAGMLIVGNVRFGIEYNWDVSTFGKVSFTLSLSNLMMLFINAMGIVLFPILRRTEKEKLTEIYQTIRCVFMILLFGLLTLYYPIKAVLSSWLPQYADSLMYMALLFPICVYEGKMAILINTYLKTLRKERLIFIINFITLILSLTLTVAFSFIMHNLYLTIASIIFLLFFRCCLAEIFLSKLLNIPVYKDMLYELLLTLVFILSGWFILSWYAVAVYLVVYILYIYIKKADIWSAVHSIKKSLHA